MTPIIPVLRYFRIPVMPSFCQMDGKDYHFVTVSGGVHLDNMIGFGKRKESNGRS